MKKNHLTTCFFISILIGGCQEPIDWDIENSAEQLVVQAAITTENKQHYVTLTTTQGYYDTGEPRGVSNAQITISEGTKTYFFLEVDRHPGLYLTETPFEAESGQSYELTIALPEAIQGQQVFTATATIPQPYQVDSIDYFLYETPETVLFDFESRVYFTVFGNDPPSPGDHFLLNVLKNSHPLTDQATDMKIWHDRWFNGEYEVKTGDFGFFEPIESGDTLTLEIRSIENEYYNFVNNLKLETSIRDPFGFLGTPANVKGNISSGGLGYFAGYASSRKSIVIK